MNSSIVNLSGCWQLSAEGSDYIPGFDSVPGIPWSGLLKPPLANQECLFIDQRKNGDHEEFTIACKLASSRRSPNSETYVVGTTNFFGVAEKRSISFIEYVSYSFDSVSITTIGPRMDQRCMETFTLGTDGNTIKAVVRVWIDNLSISFNRYLQRASPLLSHDREIHPNIHEMAINRTYMPIYFPSAALCKGWLNKQFKSPSILSELAIVMDSQLKLGSFSKKVATGADTTRIMSRYSDNPQNKDSLVIYFIKVSLRTATYRHEWVVGHRYSEFDALRKFVPSAAHGPVFPKKSLTGISTDKHVELRQKGLQEYISWLLSNLGFSDPNMILALLSFLEVPEQLQGRQNALDELANVGVGISGSDGSGAPLSARPAAPRPDSSTTSSSAAVMTADFGIPSSAAAATAPTSDAKAAAKPASKVVSVTAVATTNNSSGNSASATPTKAAATTPNVTATTITATSSSTTATKPPQPQRGVDISNSNNNIVTTKARSQSLGVVRLPQDVLFEVLNIGVVVLKHGRQGAPKKRLLRCDHMVKRLFWDKPPTASSSSSSSSKQLAGGNGLLPDLPSEDKSILLSEVTAVRRGTEDDPSESGGKKGTAILRRNIKSAEGFALCFSLITPSRSLDIQCLSQEEFDILYPNFVSFLTKS